MTKFTSILAVALAVITLPLCVPHASAQTGNRLALGLNFSTQQAPDESSVASGGHSVGFEWRIGHSKQGFGWQYALNWYSVDLDRLIGSGPTALGRLHVRPLMGGYGYTHLFRGGKIAITGDVVGGYAINSFELDPAADTAYQTRLGARAVRAEAVNTLVAKPEIQMWYDLNDRVGLLVNAGYVFARPEVKVSSSLGTDVHRVHADTYALRVGLVYSILGRDEPRRPTAKKSPAKPRTRK